MYSEDIAFKTATFNDKIVFDSFLDSRRAITLCPLIFRGVKSPKSLLIFVQKGLSSVKVAEAPALPSDNLTAVRYIPILTSDIDSVSNLFLYRLFKRLYVCSIITWYDYDLLSKT